MKTSSRDIVNYQNIHPAPATYVSFCASPHFFKKSVVVLNAVARDHSPENNVDQQASCNAKQEGEVPVINGTLPMEMASEMRVISAKESETATE